MYSPDTHLAQQFLDNDELSFDQMLDLLIERGSPSVVEPTGNENTPVVKAIRPKSLGTRLAEEERRNRLMRLPDLASVEEITLKTRNDYYFYISLQADLDIKPTKNRAKNTNKMMQILSKYEDERGTFFKVKHSSLTPTQYVFDFYETASVEKKVVKSFVVKMITATKNKLEEIQPVPVENEEGEKPRNAKRRRTESPAVHVYTEVGPIEFPVSSNITLQYEYNNNVTDEFAPEYYGVPDPVYIYLDDLFLASVTLETISPFIDSPLLMVPPAKRSGFPPKKGPKIDQANLLAEVARKLFEKQVLIIHGMSGVGKSTLASEFGYMERLRNERYEYAVWIDCKNKKTLMAGFSRIAKFLGVLETDGDQEVMKVLETLQYNNCLLIYDNCHENMVEEVFNSFFPHELNCHVIVTTQLPQSKWNIEKMEFAHLTLDNYTDECILDYIFKTLRIQDPTQETLQAARDIIKECKNFTLLMQLIPQYIRMEDLTLPDFMRKYRDMFVTLAPLNIDRLDIPIKMIIDSLGLKNKMFLRLLSFMNSLAGTQVFTESAFFVEDQLSNTKFSDLKRAVSKLKNLSLIEFCDDGQAVKIGHEWIEQYLTRSTTQDDLRLIYTHWETIFEALLKYLQTMDPDTKLNFINTATDNLVNWTSSRPPKFYIDFIEALSSTNTSYYQRYIVSGVANKDEIHIHHALEVIAMENANNKLHVIITSLFNAKMLSEKGQFSESLQLLDNCQKIMPQYLDNRHSFCQNVYREYAIALFHTGHHTQADPIFTKCYNDSRIKNDTNCYHGLNKFWLRDYESSRMILREYIIDTIKHNNQCNLDSASMREGLATFLFCEIMLNKPFPAIIHQDADMQLHQALQHATTLYQIHHEIFQSEQMTVNQLTVSVGQFHNGPEQQYTVIGCQGRVIVIYKLAIMAYWCIVYMNDFIWVKEYIRTMLLLDEM